MIAIHRTRSHAVALGLIAMTLVSALGCTERLARENVFAHTETLFGLAVEENQKTQLYEARLGYARHELFFVPTSKTIVYKVDAAGNFVEDPSSIHNDPSDTPEVIGSIELGVSLGSTTQPTTFALRQRLAVGRLAVQSGAATTLMADIGKPVSTNFVEPDQNSQKIQKWLDKDANSTGPNHVALRAWIPKNDPTFPADKGLTVWLDSGRIDAYAKAVADTTLNVSP